MTSLNQKMAEPTLNVRREAGIGMIEVNRPAAINALTVEMLEQFTDAAVEFAQDPQIRQVQLTGAGERGLCAGADVRQLRELVLSGGDVRGFFETEYRLNLLIATYPKPYLARMTGITMGGGLGISVHGSHRTVDATSRLAMPETQIGLFPDVFVSWLLARLPGEIGTHLALTGASINAADALRLGLADDCAGPVPEPDPSLAGSWIAECYAGNDPVEILGRLGEHADPAARAAADELAKRSPLSLAVSLEALRRAAAFGDRVAQYDQELALAVRLTTGPDFIEGVRAQLVDRDRNPRWAHGSLDEVSRAEVESYFVPLD
ncbi:enoyl-CoA hydratase [Propionicimonas paludicola]|uniref:3-hydroxyisobutyryl-CoA hydrolase n=2 Tax=Propionicimonas paludicola TaxID=185243 RepID=A0A2A9CSD5_9ACTN|nr:enoyl-CoA hydratase [Propionicimonas paludicola]